MASPKFRTFLASVRPSRIAVLTNSADVHWQETCRRIIEFLSSVWGGKHSIIVPTDGKTIAPIFWQLLEVFDPDMICAYRTTYTDLQRRDPAEFNKMLDTQLNVSFPNQPPTESQRKNWEQSLCSYPLDSWNIDPALEIELKNRVAPFHLDDRVVDYWMYAANAPKDPLTRVETVLVHCENTGRMVRTSVEDSGISPLWVEAELGACSPHFVKRLEATGFKCEIETYSSNDVGKLSRSVLGEVPPDKPPAAVTSSPFNLSMAGLGEYAAFNENSWRMPIMVVLGSTLEDFALYFSLSRMRPFIHWLPPEWTMSLQSLPKSSQADAARYFASHLHVESLRAHRKIEFVSTSRSHEDLSGAIDIIDVAPWSRVGSFKGEMSVGQLKEPMVDHPRTVFNRDNFMLPSTHQTVNHETVGHFETPKPKGFRAIVPYDHHWICDLRIADAAYPRHPVLGPWVIRHPALSGNSARVGRGTASFQCPSTAYFGGDVDTILIRPKLYTPDAAEVFEHLIADAGWTSNISDKGFYSRDAVRKLGGLKDAARLLRDSQSSSFLKEFLKCKGAGEGCFLTSDDRRYLTLASAETILGSRERAVSMLDALLEQSVLYRGVILKCAFCRAASWFTLGEIDASFSCRRCRRRQTILSMHAMGHGEPPWYYQLDEIVYQGLRNNMDVPLLALDALAKACSSFMYADEIEIRSAGEDRPFIEIDLNCICDGVLTIGEAKSAARIEGGGNAEVRALTKYKDVATKISARQFVLATSNTWAAETLANAARIFNGSGVGLVTLDASVLLGS